MYVYEYVLVKKICVYICIQMHIRDLQMHVRDLEIWNPVAASVWHSFRALKEAHIFMCILRYIYIYMYIQTFIYTYK